MAAPEQAIVNSWLAFLTPIALASLTVIQIISTRMAATRSHRVENATAEVKATLVKTDQKTTQKLDDIHKLVNSEYAIALRVGAAALERIALGTKDAGDIESARVARQLSVDHDQKQIALDKTKP